MSGPKRADVEAELNVARNTKRRCGQIISTAESAKLESLLRGIAVTIQQTEKLGSALDKEMKSLDGECCRVSPRETEEARNAAEEGRKVLSDAVVAQRRAQELVKNATSQEQEANNIFQQADKEYDRAVSALRKAGSSDYLHKQMEWAREAKRRYDQSAAAAEEAAKSRHAAEVATADALRRAKDAASLLKGAQEKTHSTREEAVARLRAEEEARRITEQKEREASVAAERARAALGRLTGLPCAKFCPGREENLRQELETAVRLHAEGRYDEAKKNATRIEAAGKELEREVTAAAKAFEARKTKAESAIQVLESTLANLDREMITAWADSPEALKQAEQALADSRRLLIAERFEEAQVSADSASAALSDALRTAATNRSSHEQREHIGNAIMDVLQELQFDVSYEPGSRTEPLRIAGQSPDETGRGDFDIAIPLDGEIDFEVKAANGDQTCVAAVKSLQDRLAKRGVKWETTDWGHADKVHAGKTKTTIKTTQTTKTKIMTKS
ncbi:MAG: hypothetical protein C4575_11095 [Desulforudis sp.]|jgi:hypothetical protein|nr:MAG: hypothetical protein C4575_11095 [Desulforudis sp.]